MQTVDQPLKSRVRPAFAFVVGLLVATLTACSATAGSAAAGSATASSAPAGSAPQRSSPNGVANGRNVLRLGYFPNITHAPALVGVADGTFAKALAPGTALRTKTFKAGPAAVEALFADQVDAVFMGPNPAINAYVKSHGKALRVIAGSTSGGAGLVVRAGIDTVADLRGKKLASPQLGSTQDIALRAWLAEQGLRTDIHAGGDVSVIPQQNSQTLDAIRQGHIDGAWVPEPWATRLVKDAGAKVFLDERDIWPERRFATTVLVVRKAFLESHPEAVDALVGALTDVVDAINSNPVRAQSSANKQIGVITGKTLKADVIAAAWENLSFTVDPITTSLRTSADHAHSLGLLESTDLNNLYDLRPLNNALAQRGREALEAP